MVSILRGAPAASSIRSVASMISGPMPSPWATVMGVFVDIREPPGYWNAPHRATTIRGHLLQPRRGNRGRKPGTGAKNPTRSCPAGRWKWSAFYTIAELVKFSDHPCCACAFGLGTDGRTPFLVAHPLVQNQPKQSAKPMGNGPDGLLVSQARQQPMKCHFEYASFDLYRRLSRLIQQPPHLTIPLRRARAVRLPCALFAARTHPYPRG